MAEVETAEGPVVDVPEDTGDLLDEDLDMLTGDAEALQEELLNPKEESEEAETQETKEAQETQEAPEVEEEASEEEATGEGEASEEVSEEEETSEEETVEETSEEEALEEEVQEVRKVEGESKTPSVEEALLTLLKSNPQLLQQLIRPEEQQKQQEQQLSPEQAAAQFAQVREQAEQMLAEYYKLSQDDVNALEEDPTEFLKTAIPRLTARVYVDAVVTSIQRVQQALPNIVTQIVSEREESRNAEEAFFQQWPQLREHKDTVTRIAAAYRQINPDMPQDQFMRDVGVQAMVMLGLRAEEKPSQPKARPFRPAARKKAPSTLEAPKPKNAYEQLDEELFGDDW